MFFRYPALHLYIWRIKCAIRLIVPSQMTQTFRKIQFSSVVILIVFFPVAWFTSCTRLSTEWEKSLFAHFVETYFDCNYRFGNVPISPNTSQNSWSRDRFSTSAHLLSCWMFAIWAGRQPRHDWVIIPGRLKNAQTSRNVDKQSSRKSVGHLAFIRLEQNEKIGSAPAVSILSDLMRRGLSCVFLHCIRWFLSTNSP